MDQYQQFIHKSRYARYLPEEKRRESWPETVQRYVQFFRSRFANNESVLDYLDLAEQYIVDMKAMPSMRALMTAGPALEKDNVAGYNCSFLPIDSFRSFDEAMYILMCGTGVGFSVEKMYVNKLAELPQTYHKSDTVVRVKDSKRGWASAFREIISLLSTGSIPSWDVSRIRPAGARLHTFGGRASGPDPLVSLFEFTVALFTKAAGRKLTTLECHDLMCKVADIVVVGGVRRSALISISDLDDSLMRNAKTGQWWVEHPHRALANNSAAYTNGIDFQSFLGEWKSLYDSKSGERGIFNTDAALWQAKKNGRRDTEGRHYGTNPCSEIILQPYQFCNLTEVVVRAGDTLEQLKSKVRMAAFLGTLQASLVDFGYLRAVWKRNTESEALLGVSLTGIMDHPVLSSHASGWFGDGMSAGEWLKEMKEEAIEANKFWAKVIGINQAAAITCVKPSGTVSQLVNCASGIHPRFAYHYIRRVRQDVKDPLTKWMIEQGFPHEVDKMNPQNVVFSFPVKSPEGCTTNDQATALRQIEHWQLVQDAWCEHKPSITVFYRDYEYLALGDWVFNNLSKVSGVSFLPHSDHVYEQAPYEAITEEVYNDLKSKMPDVSFDDMPPEDEDNVQGAQLLACSAGVCDL